MVVLHSRGLLLGLPEFNEQLGSLVVTPDGDVAWIAVDHTDGFIQVRSGRTVLDSGGTIKPHSLKLHGSLLSWKHGSITRTARLL